MIVLTLVYTAIALWLAVYGLNALILAFLYLRNGSRAPAAPPVGRDELPDVTVQIPVYNERHVIERIIDAVAALDYPHDRLQIQILDDSTDETTHVARERAALHRQQGLDIAVLRRSDRAGFKAGALSSGMASARGDLIAIFDADFEPHPDFLLRTVPHFLARPRLGLVQTRWAHLNEDYSPLTRAQAMAFDGHFVVEQTGRNRSGLLMNFNGTAGVWRKSCIEESGGWQFTTLSEDLDLSYRAQLEGWETLYLPDVDAPAELPPQIAAFKRQQARWTQGSVQTLRKLVGRIIRSPRLHVAQKCMAVLHLSGYLAHALMVLLLIATVPLLMVDARIPSVGNIGLVMSLGPPLVYVISQQALHRDWPRRLRSFPLLILLGVGIAWNNCRAVYRGLTCWGGTFYRTPKFRVEGRRDRWTASGYRLKVDRSVIGEAFLACYAVVGVWVAGAAGRYGIIPFMALYAASFGAVAVIEIAQAIDGSRDRQTDDL